MKQTASILLHLTLCAGILVAVFMMGYTKGRTDELPPHFTSGFYSDEPPGAPEGSEGSMDHNSAPVSIQDELERDPCFKITNRQRK